MNRGKILEGWRRKRAAGQPITGSPGGQDFIVVSNQVKLGPPGTPSIAGLLPFGDANALSLQAVRERAPEAGGVPLIAGICASDPLRLMDKFLQEIKSAGAAGVQNAPSVGLIDGVFRKNLEEAKLGYAKEVEMIRLAGRMDLITAAFVFSADDARAMAEAGADLVVIHWGVGALPAAKDRLKSLEEISAAAGGVKKDLFVLAFGPAVSAPAPMDGIQIE